MPHFIRGYFDGDGCIWMGKVKRTPYFDKKRNITYYRINLPIKFTFTGCASFISDLQDYLINKIGLRKTKLNFSQSKNINNNTCSQTCTMEYSGRGNIKKLYDYMYNTAKIFGSRKKEKFEEIFCADSKQLLSETELIAGNSLES